MACRVFKNNRNKHLVTKYQMHLILIREQLKKSLNLSTYLILHRHRVLVKNYCRPIKLNKLENPAHL